MTYSLEELSHIGVYSIHHTSCPDELYVGATVKVKKESRNSNHGFYRRFYDHCRHLKRKSHHCKSLQEIVDVQGIKGLVFTILEVCDSMSIQEIREREQYWITKLKPSYNKFDTVYPKGRRWNAQDKLKASIKMKGKRLPEKAYEKNRKPIIQLDLNEYIIKEWNSKEEAATELRIDKGSISKCANGIRNSAGGFKWKYKQAGFSKSRLFDNDDHIDNPGPPINFTP